MANWTRSIGNDTLYGDVVNHIFTVPGTHLVILAVYDARGNNASKTRSLIVTEKNDTVPPVDDDVTPDDDTKTGLSDYLFVLIFVSIFIVAAVALLLVIIFVIRKGPVSDSGEETLEE